MYLTEKGTKVIKVLKALPKRLEKKIKISSKPGKKRKKYYMYRRSKKVEEVVERLILYVWNIGLLYKRPILPKLLLCDTIIVQFKIKVPIN